MAVGSKWTLQKDGVGLSLLRRKDFAVSRTKVARSSSLGVFPKVNPVCWATAELFMISGAVSAEEWAHR